MAYIKKNVNFLLLLLTIFILLSLVGISSYYQTTYYDLSSQYNEKLEELQGLTGRLDTRREELNKTYSDLQLRLADKAKFDQLYVELSAEKEQLEKDLKYNKDQLESTRTRLLKVEGDLDSTQRDLTAAQIQIVNLQEDLAFHESRVRALENEVCSLKQQLGESC